MRNAPRVGEERGGERHTVSPRQMQITTCVTVSVNALLRMSVSVRDAVVSPSSTVDTPSRAWRSVARWSLRRDSTDAPMASLETAIAAHTLLQWSEFVDEETKSWMSG